MQARSISKIGILAASAFVFALGAFGQDVITRDRPELDVIYVPTPYDVVKRMLELAEVGKNDIHYDLGSGDGRIAIAAVKDFGARKAVGIDLDPQRIKESLENHVKSGVGDRVTFLNANIFKTDFTEATVISMYLLDTINLRLRPQLLDMRPGTRIVTQTFDMAEWRPDATETVGFRRIYLFIVPAMVAGKWEISEGERKITLDIRQNFQDAHGTATINGKTVDIEKGSLRGPKIEFTIEVDGKPVKYEGTVDGGAINGTSPTKWTAKKAS